MRRALITGLCCAIVSAALVSGAWFAHWVSVRRQLQQAHAELASVRTELAKIDRLEREVEGLVGNGGPQPAAEQPAGAAGQPLSVFIGRLGGEPARTDATKEQGKLSNIVGHEIERYRARLRALQNQIKALESK